MTRSPLASRGDARLPAALAAALLVACGTPAATPSASVPVTIAVPPPEHATFAVILGADTIVGERMTRVPASVAGEFLDRLRGVRIRYTMALAADGRATRLTTVAARTSGDTMPFQRATLVVRGDSIEITGGADTGATRTIASRGGALFYLNPSPVMLEQLLRRARAIGGASAEVPLFNVLGGQTFMATVTWAGADSATIGLGPVQMRVATDSVGRMLGGTVGSQNVRIVRGAMSGSLTPAPAPDYSAPPGAPYRAEDVTVRTPGGVRLAGTLTLPLGASAAHRVPAALLLTGSGAQARDEELLGMPGYRPFRQIADTLSRRGVAVLRLDDRGAGASDAGGPGATTDDFASDAAAALAWLRARPEIDGRRLALVGHSEGGIVAPLVASRDTLLRAIALLAGPSRPLRAILGDQQRWVVEHDSRIAPSARDSALARLRLTTDSAIAAQPWLRWLADYDPAATARRVRIPVLILHGETDRQVGVAQASELADAFRAGGNRDVTVRVFPATNHLFLPDSAGGPEGYATVRSRTVPGAVLGTLADWVATRLRQAH